MKMPFDMVDDTTNDDDQFQQGTNIKVIGVGGCGGNAVEHMIRAQVQGAHFIAANTDAQALRVSKAHTLIQLGKTGLGAGSKPEAGKLAAEAAEGDIRAALQGAHMLFITAGMGGGTGTGAAPIVAKIAKDMGILTVGVVTKPFDYEGSKRQKNAQIGVEELEEHVDSLIVVLNDKLYEVYGDDISFDDALAHSNDVLKNAVGGISEIINVPGLINVDFEDVKTVMSEPGKALMGSGIASGPDRATIAAQQAVQCPLLEGVELSGARGVLVNISAKRGALKQTEVRSAMNEVRNYASPEAHIIVGTAYDDSLGDELRVTVVATGLSRGAGIIRRDQPQALPQTTLREAAQPFTLLRTGTDGGVAAYGNQTASNVGAQSSYDELQTPTVWRNPRAAAAARVDALVQNGMDEIEIPAFLRKQAD
jgi:cell division protein FtsZ